MTIPSLDLTKTVDWPSGTPQSCDVGQVVPYKFVVDNNGQKPFQKIDVVEPKVSGVSCASTELDFGDQMECTANYVVNGIAGQAEGTLSVTISDLPERVCSDVDLGHAAQR